MRRSLVGELSLREVGGSDEQMSLAVLFEVSKDFGHHEVLHTITIRYLCWRGRESSLGLPQPGFGFLETLFKLNDLILDCLRLQRVGYVTAHRGSMVHRYLYLVSSDVAPVKVT
jgi:hypothetical protein